MYNIVQKRIFKPHDENFGIKWREILQIGPFILVVRKMFFSSEQIAQPQAQSKLL